MGEVFTDGFSDRGSIPLTSIRKKWLELQAIFLFVNNRIRNIDYLYNSRVTTTFIVVVTFILLRKNLLLILIILNDILNII